MTVQELFKEIDESLTTSMVEKLKKDGIVEKNPLSKCFKSKAGCPVHQDITVIAKGGFAFYCMGSFGKHNGSIKNSYSSSWVSNHATTVEMMKNSHIYLKEDIFKYVNFTLPNQIIRMFTEKYAKDKK